MLVREKFIPLHARQYAPALPVLQQAESSMAIIGKRMQM